MRSILHNCYEGVRAAGTQNGHAASAPHRARSCTRSRARPGRCAAAASSRRPACAPPPGPARARPRPRCAPQTHAKALGPTKSASKRCMRQRSRMRTRLACARTRDPCWQAAGIQASAQLHRVMQCTEAIRSWQMVHAAAQHALHAVNHRALSPVLWAPGVPACSWHSAGRQGAGGHRCSRPKMVSRPPAASCSTVPPSASTASFTVCALPSAMTGEGNAAGLRTTCACRRASARAHAGASGAPVQVAHAECMPACTACGRQGHG